MERQSVTWAEQDLEPKMTIRDADNYDEEQETKNASAQVPGEATDCAPMDIPVLPQERYHTAAQSAVLADHELTVNFMLQCHQETEEVRRNKIEQAQHQARLQRMGTYRDYAEYHSKLLGATLLIQRWYRLWKERRERELAERRRREEEECRRREEERRARLEAEQRRRTALRAVRQAVIDAKLAAKAQVGYHKQRQRMLGYGNEPQLDSLAEVPAETFKLLQAAGLSLSHAIDIITQQDTAAAAASRTTQARQRRGSTGCIPDMPYDDLLTSVHPQAEPGTRLTFPVPPRGGFRASTTALPEDCNQIMDEDIQELLDSLQDVHGGDFHRSNSNMNDNDSLPKLLVRTLSRDLDSSSATWGPNLDLDLSDAVMRSAERVVGRLSHGSSGHTSLNHRFSRSMSHLASGEMDKEAILMQDEVATICGEPSAVAAPIELVTVQVQQLLHKQVLLGHRAGGEAVVASGLEQGEALQLVAWADGREGHEPGMDAADVEALVTRLEKAHGFTASEAGPQAPRTLKDTPRDKLMHRLLLVLTRVNLQCTNGQASGATPFLALTPERNTDINPLYSPLGSAPISQSPSLTTQTPSRKQHQPENPSLAVSQFTVPPRRHATFFTPFANDPTGTIVIPTPVLTPNSANPRPTRQPLSPTRLPTSSDRGLTRHSLDAPCPIPPNPNSSALKPYKSATLPSLNTINANSFFSTKDLLPTSASSRRSSTTTVHADNSSGSLHSTSSSLPAPPFTLRSTRRSSTNVPDVVLAHLHCSTESEADFDLEPSSFRQLQDNPTHTLGIPSRGSARTSTYGNDPAPLSRIGSLRASLTHAPCAAATHMASSPLPQRQSGPLNPAHSRPLHHHHSSPMTHARLFHTRPDAGLPSPRPTTAGGLGAAAHAVEALHSGSPAGMQEGLHLQQSLSRRGSLEHKARGAPERSSLEQQAAGASLLATHSRNGRLASRAQAAEPAPQHILPAIPGKAAKSGSGTGSMLKALVGGFRNKNSDMHQVGTITEVVRDGVGAERAASPSKSRGFFLGGKMKRGAKSLAEQLGLK